MSDGIGTDSGFEPSGVRDEGTDISSLSQARQHLYEVMRSDRSFDQKARSAVELGRQYFGADNAHLTQIDEEADRWEAIVSTDPADGDFPPGLELRLGTTYCRRTIEADDRIALHDAPEQGWADDLAFETHGLHCYHGTTLVLDGEPYGTLCFVSEDPRAAPYSEGETMFAELIARMLERELENERYESLLTQQANLAVVLTRVPRHNLQSNMPVIRGYTQVMAEKLDNETIGEITLCNIDSVIGLGEKTRELDHITASTEDSIRTDIQALVQELADEVQQEHPQAAISVLSDQQVTAEILPRFERVITELIKNAIKHSGATPTITITVTRVPNAVEIGISDDGPGLDQHEIDVFETGSETSPTHGSDLGMWLVYRIVTNHDGSIGATTSDDGTTVTVTVPEQQVLANQDQIRSPSRAHDRYKSAFEEAANGMLITDDEGRILDVNAEAAQTCGLDRQQLLGRPIGEFLPDPVTYDTICEDVAERDAEPCELSVQNADGERRLIECTVKTNFVPGQSLIISRDITDRKERERILDSQTRQLRAVLDNVDAAAWIRDADGTYVMMNETFRELFDIDTDTSVRGNSAAELLPTDTVSRFQANHRSVYETGEPVEIEETIETTGGVREFLTRINPIFSDGAVSAACGVAVDITEQKHRERELAKITQRLESVVEILPDPIVVLDEEGYIELWNNAAEDVFGYSSTEAVGTQVQSLEILQPDQHGLFEERFATVLSGNTIRDLSVTRRGKGDSCVELEVSAAPLRDAAGTVTGVVVAAQDITERMNRIQTLEQYEAVFEKAGDGITITNDEGDVLAVNAEAAKIYGEPRDELLGRSMQEFLPTEFDFEAEWGTEQAAKMKRDEVDVLSSDGGPQTIEYTAAPYFLPNQHLIISRDVTDRKAHERKLERQLDRLDEFASVVSHDLRNPLNVAQGHLNLASEELNSDHFEPIERAHSRMESLIDDVLTLARSRSTVADVEQLDYSELITNCWANVDTENATLDIQVQRSIQADEGRVKQLFENLFRNSIEHGGTDVTVTVGELEDGFFVEDNGTGIETAARDNVFDDGYSTREEGTGFGLTIVKQAVEAHDWNIHVTDSSDEGARFEITGVKFGAE
jgi:PAS domain S-box-containing protein